MMMMMLTTTMMAKSEIFMQSPSWFSNLFRPDGRARRVAT